VDGRPWVSAPSGGPQAIKIRQYGRLEGEYELPARVVVKTVTAKLMEGGVMRSTQAINL
jgi:HSP20 family molecular chaperone IbpA